MVAESGLIKKLFFISPEYEDKFTNIQDYGEGDDKRCEASKYDDKRDTFPTWLSQNSFYTQLGGSINTLTGEREDIVGFSRFMGKNGVYCQIKTEKIHTSPKYMPPLGYHGKYFRVVEISQMPSSNDLPEELLNTLKEFGYNGSLVDDANVQRLIKSSTRFPS